MRFVRFIISFYFLCVTNLKNTIVSASSDEVTIYSCYDIPESHETTRTQLEVPAEATDVLDSYFFRLSQKQENLNCGDIGSFNYSVSLNETRENYDSGFSSTGILTVKTGFVNFYRYPKDYCVLSISNDTVFLSVCNATCDNEQESNRLCIKKCCPLNMVLGYDDEGRIGCGKPTREEHFSQWMPEIHKNVYGSQSVDKNLELSIYYEDWGKMNKCLDGVSTIINRPKYFMGDYHEDINTQRFRLLENGNLSVCSDTTRRWLQVHDEFCVDLIENFIHGNETSGDLVTLSALRCVPPTDPVAATTGNDEMHSAQIIIIYHVCVPIASAFLLIVIIVYTLLWDSQNVHGFTVLSYVWSLFLLYISLILSVVISEKANMYCKVAGVAVHFLFISTFCWLTAISFDIWWKFRHLKQSSPSKQIKKYLIYCALSFAVPVVIITIGLLMDEIDERSSCQLSDQEFRLIAPNYGKRLCGVDGPAQGWYIYFPTGILLGCNALFFGMTVYAMHMHKKSTNCVLEGNCTKEHKPILLFSKLFIVMGFAWILEFVGWAIRQDRSRRDGLFSWLTLVFDTVNLLQAVVIFYVFVCKKRIFVQLWHEHMWLRGVLILFVKTGCYEIPPERTKPFANASTERGQNKCTFRFLTHKTSNLSDTSTTTITSKLSSSNI